MKITYLGHACVNIEIDGNYFLIDPFISGNSLAKHIDLQTIKADYILLTHAHTDHIWILKLLLKIQMLSLLVILKY